jgi:riboflavin kinase/FMN adenylyltransferase
MRVIYSLGNNRLHFKKVIATIGVFDGVHIAHQKIIKKVILLAKREKAKSLVITFWPHPLKVLKEKDSSLMLTSLKHRINLIRKLNPDICLIIKFTKRFAKLNPEQFINTLKLKINVIKIVVGEDFLFGSGVKGDVRYLRNLGDKFGFTVVEIPEHKIGRFPIRSNFIRNLIKTGKLKTAKSCLGRDVRVYGKVIKGTQRGRFLGYPTANIKTYQEIMPPEGVYLVKVIIDCGVFFGISNIGKRPTFGDSKKSIMEAYIFNFKKNIYNRELEAIFLKKIRNEKKFANRSKLIEQIRNDELKAKTLIQKFRIRHIAK